uniref:Galectin n=1 Tax=Globodera pallida TaxID=36090 RepID=A0A183CIA9_GLOPA
MFTNPTDPLHDISWGKLDQGSTECDKDAPNLKIKYPIEALRPFNEKTEIVIEGLVGAGNITVILQSFPYDWSVFNSRIHNGDRPTIETTEFLSLEKNCGFEVFITFEEDKFITELNKKKMVYVRNNTLQKILPLWKITHFAVSGDVNIFEKKAPKCDIPDFNEPPRGSFSGFSTKLIETLMPGFVVLKIKLSWNKDTKKGSMNFLNVDEDELDNEFTNKADEDEINTTSGGTFIMGIIIGYWDYNVTLNGRLIGKIAVEAEKKALPAWLIEYIHISGGLEIEEGYPKVKPRDEPKVAKLLRGFDLPYVRKLNAPLRVGDVVHIKTRVDRTQKYSKYEIGFYNRGWSYIRPYQNGEDNELTNEVTNKADETEISTTSGGTFFMEIIIGYFKFDVKLNRRSIGQISVEAEKKALPAWLIEYIHVNIL